MDTHKSIKPHENLSPVPGFEPTTPGSIYQSACHRATKAVGSERREAVFYLPPHSPMTTL